MNETNYSAVDFSALSATDDGKTLLYADNQLCQSISSLSEVVDSKIGDKGYATEDYVDGAVESLSSEADNKFATKEDLGKVGNFIVTSGDPETFEPVLDPASAETKSIYLVQNEDVSGKDQYYEWIVTENDDTVEWTCIGETTVDLKDYAKIADVNAALALKQDTLTAGTDLVISGGVIGVNTNGMASGTYSFAGGENTYASGDAAYAFGQNASAKNHRAVAFGFSTLSDGEETTVIGRYNTNSTAAFIIGNGNDYDNHSDAFIVDWNGVASATKLATSGIADIETAITSINGVPTSTIADEGKVLTVDSNGDAEWVTAGGGTDSIEIFDISNNTYPTYSQIAATVQAGKIPVLKGKTYGSIMYYFPTGSFESALYAFATPGETGIGIISIKPDDSITKSNFSHDTLIYTGSWNPNAITPDYSGLPDASRVFYSSDGTRDVTLILDNNGSKVTYHLCQADTNEKYFIGISDSAGTNNYIQGLKLTYSNGTYTWSSMRYLNGLKSETISEEDIQSSGGHCGVNNVNALTTIALTTINSVTLHTNNYPAVNDFTVEIDNRYNSNNVTIDVQHGPTSLYITNSTITAGKYCQLRCIGYCVTVTEF